MEGLQRSAVSFRRQGSSGMVWDDKFLAGLNQLANEQQKLKEGEASGSSNDDDVKKENDEKKLENNKQGLEKDQQGSSGGGSPLPAVGLRVERSRSNGGGRGFRTGKVSPAIDPPSPRVSACGCFGKKSSATRGNKTRRRAANKRVM